MKQKILIFLITAILALGFIGVKEVKAGASDNVWGWAWSNMDDKTTPNDERTIGWISFNSENCISNPGGLTNLAQCSGGGGNYGVNINSSTGGFSGYAYFDINDPNTPIEEVGWIDFAPAGPYPTCPSTTCPSGSPNYSAKADLSCPSDKCWVTGWARACNVFQTGCSGALKTDIERGGWDGWILLGPIVKGGTNYGVYIYKSTSPYQFHGWAWGSDVIGWVSFNCAEGGADICVTKSNYKVLTDLSLAPVNNPPYVEPGSAVIEYQEYCDFSPTGRVGFKWQYQDDEGDEQLEYTLQIDNTDSNFNNLVVNYTANQSVSAGGYGSAAVNIVQNPTGPLDIGYNDTYYWRVKVRAVSGNPEWSAPEQGPNFSTPSHPKPNCAFAPQPASPQLEQAVNFIDNSICYTASGSYNCKDNTFGLVSPYKWDFDYPPFGPDATLPPGDASHTYSSADGYLSGDSVKVQLQVTDNAGMCPTEVNFILSAATLPLPKWKEIAPF